MSMHKAEKPVCTVCGSDDIRRDAYAEWSVEKQEWILVTVFDNTDCEKCGGECSIDWVPLDERLRESGSS